MGVSPHPLCALTISSPVCSVLPLPRTGPTGMAGKLNVIALTPCQESCLTVDGIFHLDAGQVPCAPRPSAPPSPTRGTPAAHREVLSTSDMLGPCFFSYTWLCWCFSPLPCFLLGAGGWLPCCDTLPVPCPPCCAVLSDLMPPVLGHTCCPSLPRHPCSAVHISPARRRSWSWQDPSWPWCPLATACPCCSGTPMVPGPSCRSKASSGR